MKICLAVMQAMSIIHLLSAAPSVVFGPSQRNKMHRLMHAPGADMHKEDQAKMKREQKEDQRRGGAQPMDQETYLHRVGMHGDIKNEAKHDKEKSLKEPKEANGPCQGMDCLHGVLMHNDDEQGHDHGKEDADMRKDERRGKGRVPSVQDPHEKIHGHHRSIAETAEIEKAKRKAMERQNKEKTQQVPNKDLKFPEEEEESKSDSYWDSFKHFLGFSSNKKEKKEDDSLSMDMMHDLEGIGRVGPLKHVHGHDKENPRLKRTEHKSKAHQEH